MKIIKTVIFWCVSGFFLLTGIIGLFMVDALSSISRLLIGLVFNPIAIKLITPKFTYFSSLWFRIVTTMLCFILIGTAMKIIDPPVTTANADISSLSATSDLSSVEPSSEMTINVPPLSEQPSSQTVSENEDGKLPANGIVSSSSNESSNQTSSKYILASVDFNKVIASTIEECTDSKYYSYVKDVLITVDEVDKIVAFTAALGDATAADVALEYSDTLIRFFGFQVSINNSNYSMPSFDTYGGIFDEYDISMSVAPLSKIKDMKEWYISDYVMSGMHTKQGIQLEKKYR